MPLQRRTFEYPKSDVEVRRSQWALVHQLHGSEDPELLFKGHDKTMTAWPSAGRTKSNPKGYDQGLVDAAVRDPSRLIRDLDPRNLHATQPWVTRAGVNFYMGDTYRQTGRTFADMNQAGNRFPVVYTDDQGRNKLLSGHHRATAALLRGDQFRAIHIEE